MSSELSKTKDWRLKKGLCYHENKYRFDARDLIREKQFTKLNKIHVYQRSPT